MKKWVLHRIGPQGLRIAVDDTGTGYVMVQTYEHMNLLTKMLNDLSISFRTYKAPDICDELPISREWQSPRGPRGLVQYLIVKFNYVELSSVVDTARAVKRLLL